MIPSTTAPPHPRRIAWRINALAPAIALAAMAFALLSPSLAAQERDAPPPEQVAEEFNRGFQSMAWAGLVQRIHPEALAYLRLATDVLVQADTSGYVLESLLGGTPAGDYAGLPDDEVVRRTLAGVQREVPGLLSSLVTRRTEVLGVVVEGENRHAVYRILALVQGAEPEIRVMTLRQHQGRWKVVSAEDIRVLHTAIRRIPYPS